MTWLWYRPLHEVIAFIKQPSIFKRPFYSQRYLDCGVNPRFPRQQLLAVGSAILGIVRIQVISTL
jgi:hypothetical protein